MKIQERSSFVVPLLASLLVFIIIMGCGFNDLGKLIKDQLTKQAGPRKQRSTATKTEKPSGKETTILSPCWIYFVSERDGNPEIYRLSLPHQKLVRITNDKALDLSPKPGPQGLAWIKTITINENTGETQAVLCLTDFEGRDFRQLTSKDLQVSSFCWSPQGNRLFFHAFRTLPDGTLNPGIYSYDLSTNQTTTLGERDSEFTFYPNEYWLSTVFNGNAAITTGADSQNTDLWCFFSAAKGDISKVTRLFSGDAYFPLSLATDGRSQVVVSPGNPGKEKTQALDVELKLLKLDEADLQDRKTSSFEVAWNKSFRLTPPTDYQMLEMPVAFCNDGTKILGTPIWRYLAGSSPIVQWELWTIDTATGKTKRVYKEPRAPKSVPGLKSAAIPTPDAVFTPDGKGVIFCRGIVWGEDMPDESEMKKVESSQSIDLYYLDLYSTKTYRLTGPKARLNYSPSVWPVQKPVRSEAEAVKIVTESPAVKEWLAQVKVANAKGRIKSTPKIEFDRKDSHSYVIHVYEIVEDEEAGTSHSATFNWYAVDFKTGSIYTIVF